MSTDVGAAVEAARAELVALCAALVAAPSPNPPGDTEAVAAVVRDYLAGHGIEVRTVSKLAAMPNIIATIEGNGPGPHLVLNVHLDTMPAGDESSWTVPRYELTEQDGRLHGLGMGNMKGAVAAMSLATVLLERSRSTWPGRVTFAAVSDECVFGDNGAAFLLDEMPELVGDALICGEGPGWMRLGAAEKGVAWFELTARGEAGHSSRALERASAVTRLAGVVVAIEELNGGTAALPAGLEALAADADDPGIRLSVNVGTFTGGTLISQRPTSATAEVDARIPPGMTVAEIERALAERVDRAAEVLMRRQRSWEPNWTALDTPIARAVALAAETVRGVPVVPAVRLPASDASRWRARGVPAICYGPQPTLSAGVDDYALEEDVIACSKIYGKAALDYLTRFSSM